MNQVSAVVGAQVELLPVEVPMEILHVLTMASYSRRLKQ
jgi:hypothetical protein